MNQINYETNLKYIAKMYKDSKKEILNINQQPIVNCKLNSDFEYVSYIDNMLSLMPEEFERILRHDYFDTRVVKWWQEFYKKSTYYRRKREAVETFVDCLSL